MSRTVRLTFGRSVTAAERPEDAGEVSAPVETGPTTYADDDDEQPAGPPATVTTIDDEADALLRQYWDAHPDFLAHERDESGEDPLAADPLPFWRIELAETEHADVRSMVDAAEGELTEAAASRWTEEADAEQRQGESAAEAEAWADVLALAKRPLDV